MALALGFLNESGDGQVDAADGIEQIRAAGEARPGIGGDEISERCARVRERVRLVLDAADSDSQRPHARAKRYRRAGCSGSSASPTDTEAFDPTSVLYMTR